MSYPLVRVPKPRAKPKRKRKPLCRGGRLSPKGKRTKKSGGHLFPKNVDADYRSWIRTLPCIIWGQWRWIEAKGISVHHDCTSDTRFCHVKSRGAGGGDYANGYPGCDAAHDEQHRIGIKSFQRRWDVNLRKVAAHLAACYEKEHRGGKPRRAA